VCKSEISVSYQRTTIFYITRHNAIEQLKVIDQNQTVDKIVIAQKPRQLESIK